MYKNTQKYVVNNIYDQTGMIIFTDDKKQLDFNKSFTPTESAC